MLPENITAILARNETWEGQAASEPYEAGWAREAVVFIRSLGPPKGAMPPVRVQISPDGMNWVDEGTTLGIPDVGKVSVAKISHFGNWLRLAADLESGTSAKILATLHLKA